MTHTFWDEILKTVCNQEGKSKCEFSFFSSSAASTSVLLRLRGLCIGTVASCHLARKHVRFSSFVLPSYENGIFGDKMGHQIISINNDTGNSSLGW